MGFTPGQQPIEVDSVLTARNDEIEWAYIEQRVAEARAERDRPKGPERPVGMSNSAWALHQLGYEKPGAHWGWTGEFR